MIADSIHERTCLRVNTDKRIGMRSLTLASLFILLQLLCSDRSISGGLLPSLFRVHIKLIREKSVVLEVSTNICNLSNWFYSNCFEFRLISDTGEQ